MGETGSAGPTGKPRHGNLKVSVRRSGLLGRLRGPIVATWMEFDPQRMDFEADADLDVDARLLIDLSVEDVRATDVVAVVRDRRPASSGVTRYGVTFEYEASAHMRNGGVRERLVVIQHALKQISPHLAKDSLMEITPIERNEGAADA